MPWPPEFSPEKKSNSLQLEPVYMHDRLHFILGAVSEKGLSEIDLLINPKSMTISMTQMSNPLGVRVGWSIEHAGQGFDQMSVNGSSAACYLNGAGLVTACSKEYMQHNTAAMKQVNDLVMMFMDNGSVRAEGAPYVIDLVGHIFIQYDGVTYIGRFDELEIVESADRPYLVDFSFLFTVHSQIREG